MMSFEVVIAAIVNKAPERAAKIMEKIISLPCLIKPLIQQQ